MSMKRWGTVLMAAIMLVSLGIPALAQEQDAYLAQLEGEYEELFTVICDPQYDQIWLDACAPYVDEADLRAHVDMLQATCMGEPYGEEAIAAYTANPEETLFNCFFIEGVAKITIAGNEISGVDAEGNTVFSHEYRYAGDDELPGFASFRVYESVDADAGAFTYFSFAPDTPEETFHIEFRYGADREELAKLMEGPYAYWLAAGIRTPYTQEDIDNVIELFCVENSAEEEGAA